MRSLATVAAQPGSTGIALPTVFSSLASAGIKPRRGTVTMIAAPPGTGKSTFALYYVGRLAKMGVRTLYFSADTDEMTVCTRALAMVEYVTIGAAERRVEAGDTSSLERIKNVRWVFESDPTYNDLVEEIAAYFEVYGDWPEVIVIDNLMNVVGENEDEWGSLRDHTRAFKRLTRLTGSAIIAIHHMREGDRELDHPRPRRDVEGRISQLPEMILSLRWDNPVFQVSAVKQRWGPSDPSGKTYVELFADFDCVQFFNNWHAYQARQPA